MSKESKPAPPFTGRPARSRQQRSALSRWDGAGGEKGKGGESGEAGHQAPTAIALTNAELVRLQVRVIALENLVIALLSGASDHTCELAHGIADCIAPRAGFTPHPLTIQAAELMGHLVDRSTLFKSDADG